MPVPNKNKYLWISCVMHAALLLVFVFGLEHASPNYTLRNTNKHDVINAVVLGDTIKSKILPHEKPVQVNVAKKAKKTKKPKLAKARKITREAPKKAVRKTVAKKVVKKNAIGLKVKKKVAKKKSKRKKIARKKAKIIKQNKDAVLNKLLADIKSNNEKKIKAKKQLQKEFAKILKMQSEKSLRQQLLDEEIKLQAKKESERQGIVNKYKALILQSIAQNWIVPMSSDRTLKSELMISLAPGGVVMDVKVMKSSGDPALDSSARSAVLKSSPLPVPAETFMFEPFRRFVLEVNPQNIIEI